MSRRKSLLDTTRRSNFLRESFCGRGLSREDYVVLLTREYVQWLDLYKETKKSLAKKSYNIVAKQEDLNILSEEEKAYEDARPNYMEITKNCLKYIDLVMFWNKLVDIHNANCNKIQSEMEEKRHFIIQQLLADEKEICNECNNGFCMKDIHCLIDQNSNIFELDNYSL